MAQINFSTGPSIFKFREETLGKRRLMKTSKKPTVKHRVDFISTFYLVQQKALSWVTMTWELVQRKGLSSATRHLTWYSGKARRG